MNPLLERFERTVEACGPRLAAADQSLMVDYRTLIGLAGGLARSIAAQTDRPHVGILAPTSTAAALAIFATWYAGRTPVPLNFLLSPDELRPIVADAGLDLIVTVQHFEPLAAAVGAKTLLMAGKTMAPQRIEPPNCAAGDTAVIIYTSGTSGAPKGVCLSFTNLLGNVDGCVAHARLAPDQVFLSVLPQFHSFGFTAMTVVPLLLGATVWYLPRFSPLMVLNTIQEQRVSVFMAVASMFGALLHAKDAPPDALRGLTLAISGGEPLPMRVFEAFRERFGVSIMEGYGLTETSPVVSINTPWACRPGSVGRPLPGIEVCAVDAGGAVLRPGGEGELLIRGHCVMQGYYQREEETRQAIHDGALRTGDVGRVDEEGYVHITGRAKEMLIVGGENVVPREIENVLLDHPAVAEAAVIGMRDELRGELPVAFVILKEGADPASAGEVELRNFCRSRLAGYKVPRSVRIEKELPRSPTGKILKRALRA